MGVRGRGQGLTLGGCRGSRPKTHWGIRLLDKIMSLQGVTPTIQPLGVGYANRLKRRGMWRFPISAGQPGVDLRTSAR